MHVCMRSTGVVTWCNAGGIPINPKQPPHTPQPTPVKPVPESVNTPNHPPHQQQQQTQAPATKPPKTSQILAKEKAAQEAAAKGQG